MLKQLYPALSIFILIGVGVFAQLILDWRRSFSEKMLCKIGIGCASWTETLNKFVLYLALPALIFSSLYKIDVNGFHSFEPIGLNILLISTVLLLIAWITRLCNVKRELANAYLFGGFFGNIAFIGFPFILALDGNAGGTLSILVAVHVCVAFTLGVYFLEHSKHKDVSYTRILKRILINPLIHSVLLGAVFAFFSIPLPSMITNAISMLGASSSPVVLVALGMFMADHIRFEKDMIHSLAISLIKLITMPLLFLLTAFQMDIIPSFKISILEAAMPVAIMNFALSEIYPIDKKIIANAVIISTVLSMITLSFFALLIMI